MQDVLIAPSILAANFANLADEVHRVEAAGADWIHCDIMDGHFVDNISFGPAIVAFVRKLTKLPLDVHLMIEHADHYVPRFVQAGASSITVHVESESKHDVAKTLRQIRESGCRIGLTLNPATAFAEVEPFLDQIDMSLRNLELNTGVAEAASIGYSFVCVTRVSLPSARGVPKAVGQ